MKKLLGWALLSLSVSLFACGAESGPTADGDEELVGDVEQAVPKGGVGVGSSCTLRQCNGTLNPFGTCASTTPLGCGQCTAGGHVGLCSAAGGCVEGNCPPPKSK